MHHHVGVLILRALGAVALGIGVRRHMENVLLQNPMDVPIDIVAKARIDLVQYIAAIEERPHFADSLVADAGQDAADVIQIGVDCAPLLVPVRLFGRRPQQDRKALLTPRLRRAGSR